MSITVVQRLKHSPFTIKDAGACVLCQGGFGDGTPNPAPAFVIRDTESLHSNLAEACLWSNMVERTQLFSGPKIGTRQSETLRTAHSCGPTY